MKKFIPAGTPGTFRPGHGEYPEPLTIIDAWLCQGGLISRHQGWYMKNGKLNKSVYAWQYAPTPPPVDGFEAFKQAWSDGPDLIGGHGYRYYPASGLLFDGYNPEPSRRGMGAFVTLEAAQEAAYAHFLQSINDPTQ